MVYKKGKMSKVRKETCNVNLKAWTVKRVSLLKQRPTVQTSANHTRKKNTHPSEDPKQKDHLNILNTTSNASRIATLTATCPQLPATGICIRIKNPNSKPFWKKTSTVYGLMERGMDRPNVRTSR